eukprot:CAMPEP_0204905508 /NCGR_PEP_ID=MMETSP1397-20131031/5458_1 /ASSEMBLY_ACC=CAM_ASM_000891 /TAXON_ID=49980 /ORGANISM="Climacostomum Climacostomum virens, Strain Stock W-24" /LENGTH=190 /DNA_ID=CAMNT_0052074393 /DNA_START=293 /DNA_END=863 /DNA_ORIENTATION=-
MPTSGSRDIDPITLAKIKQKAQEREYEIVDDPIGKIKLKSYTTEDSALTYEAPLNIYYCSLCGAHVLVTNQEVQKLNRRRTDKAFIFTEDDGVFQRYMTPGETVYLRRKGGIEKQYRWNCKECGVFVAYQAVAHATLFGNEIAPLERVQKLGTKPVLYVLKNVLALDTCFSELVEAIRRKRAEYAGCHNN